MQEILNQLRARILRHCHGEERQIDVPRIGLSRRRDLTTPMPRLCEPLACFIMQGAKEVMIGRQRLRYDIGSCFASSVALHVSGSVVETPYVAVGISLDPLALSRLIADLPSAKNEGPGGFGVAAVTPEVLLALNSLLALLDTPKDIPILAAMRERELLYRLLQSDHGPMLRRIAQKDSDLARIGRVIDWIRRHYTETIRTETLSDIAGMSNASLHRHFKTATGETPLQYQKWLRLHEARRLMHGGSDVACAAYAVGYESPSQFSREYGFRFGMSPTRDVASRRTDLPFPYGVTGMMTFNAG
jgi:AraC-like DNA-binding protein